MRVIEILFWTGAFIVFYTYLGYGIILGIMVRIKEYFRPYVKPQLPSDLPHVTLFIAAYNEELIVREKMENVYNLIYPKDKLHVLWVTDGSDDRTNEILKGYTDVMICYTPERRGKSMAINHGMEYVQTPYVVYTDANAMLNKEALLEIIRLFGNPKVGCVAGEKRVHQGEKQSAGATEGIYWKYESKLKEWDYHFYSAVGAAGELFALRTNLFMILSEDTLLDDFILSLRIAMKGYRIGYCREAYAMETASVDMNEEAKRKKRISAGGLQSIFRLLPLLNIFKYGRLSWQYISHRVLRWTITPFTLFALFPLNIILLWSEHVLLYSIILFLQVIFYLMAFVGTLLARRQLRNKILFVPYYFIFMNLNVFAGIKYLFLNKQKGVWEKAKRA